MNRRCPSISPPQKSIDHIENNYKFIRDFLRQSLTPLGGVFSKLSHQFADSCPHGIEQIPNSVHEIADSLYIARVAVSQLYRLVIDVIDSANRGVGKLSF
ncbi:hypothetical protein [Paraburkholderia humisilvae]|uniref:Uncharacterized protein n=1 Tax=Paraburkholderia humisilvae TaxID=627669 RepID=A0A6J5F5B6_9BURK|nr:hypothetical protein LMG29542_07543 [Paraburkholderia humisilvae]